MMFLNRPFEGGEDVIRLREFLGGMVARHGQRRFLHMGDFLWGLVLWQDWQARATRDLRIWQSPDGSIAGFCWFSPPDWMDVQVDPDQSAGGKIETEMLAWARARAASESDGEAVSLHVGAFDQDERKLAVLRSLGFIHDGGHEYTYYAQSLSNRVAPAAIPDGAMVRSIASADDFADRVAIHQEVWHPSRVTFDLYQNVRAAPGYRSDLDLVAVAPDGRFAAYAICWYDAVNRIGEFEPVGARAAYRRRGYSQAVIAAGLRRLRDLGAVEAIVYSAAENDASNALYKRCGFNLVGRFLDLRLDIRTSETGSEPQP